MHGEARSTGLVSHVGGKSPAAATRATPGYGFASDALAIAQRALAMKQIMFIAPMAGGEFIIVECRDTASWKVLEAKGHPINRNGKYAAIYIPQHLLGVETGTSVLAAATMGHATGGNDVRPICDLQGRAARDLKKGHVLEMGDHHHTIDGVDAFIGKASPVSPGSPLPFYLFSHLSLVRDVPAGRTIQWEDVEIPAASVLLRLRREQDKAFGLA